MKTNTGRRLDGPPPRAQSRPAPPGPPLPSDRRCPFPGSDFWAGGPPGERWGAGGGGAARSAGHPRPHISINPISCSRAPEWGEGSASCGGEGGRSGANASSDGAFRLTEARLQSLSRWHP